MRRMSKLKCIIRPYFFYLKWKATLTKNHWTDCCLKPHKLWSESSLWDTRTHIRTPTKTFAIEIRWGCRRSNSLSFMHTDKTLERERLMYTHVSDGRTPTTSHIECAPNCIFGGKREDILYDSSFGSAFYIHFVVVPLKFRRHFLRLSCVQAQAQSIFPQIFSNI